MATMGAFEPVKEKWSGHPEGRFDIIDWAMKYGLYVAVLAILAITILSWATRSSGPAITDEPFGAITVLSYQAVDETVRAGGSIQMERVYCNTADQDVTVMFDVVFSGDMGSTRGTTGGQTVFEPGGSGCADSDDPVTEFSMGVPADLEPGEYRVVVNATAHDPQSDRTQSLSASTDLFNVR